MYTDLHVKYRHSVQILKKLKFPRQSFKEYSRMNVHEDTSCGRRAAVYGRKDGRGFFAILLKRLIIHIKNKIYIMANI